MSDIPKLSSILNTAREILKENNNKPMHIKDIADEAVKSARNQSMTADNFSKKLGSALAAHMKLRTQKPVFSKPINKKTKRPFKGMYRLKQQHVASIASRVTAPEVSANFMGNVKCQTDYVAEAHSTHRVAIGMAFSRCGLIAAPQVTHVP